MPAERAPQIESTSKTSDDGKVKSKETADPHFSTIFLSIDA